MLVGRQAPFPTGFALAADGLGKQSHLSGWDIRFLVPVLLVKVDTPYRGDEYNATSTSRFTLLQIVPKWSVLPP